MEDNLILDAAERYFKGEMSPEEKVYFEDLRKNNPEVDLLVVEHSMFLNQLDAYGQTRDFKHQLHEIHKELLTNGDISEDIYIKPTGKVVILWHKYKKVTAIAASIAGFTAILISSLISFFTPGNNKDILLLNRKIDQVMHNVKLQDNKINVVLASNSKVPANEVATKGGSSFLINGKGYLATNAHVVEGASTIIVQNNKGQEFKAVIAHIDNLRDLAILKIEDIDFKPLTSLPYNIRKTAAELGEPVFTLGFPRDEIVYNEGYMSAKTGYKGDTSTCQIAVSANPGNSGGPVFNRNGEVIGILSKAQSKAEGVVFAIKSRSVYETMDDLKKEDSTYAKIKPTNSGTSMKGMDRVQQIKQIEDCVFMVKSFTR